MEYKFAVALLLILGILYISKMFIYTESETTAVPVIKNRKEKYLVVETANEQNRTFPVIANVPGGIGNQLFEFACAYAIAKKRNANTYVLAPHKNDLRNKNDTHPPAGRAFALDHFKINFTKKVTEDFSSYGTGEIFSFTEQNIWEHSLPTDKVLRVVDVCVSEVYFKEYREEIKEMFTLDIDENPIVTILKKVENCQSVSVHVRRGDYTKPIDNRTIPITFQKRAMKIMEKMVPSATFFVFSDDLEYAREEFKEYKNVVFVDNSNERLASLYDLLIMTRCKHNIISNSTFSWWAAYLNRNEEKIVIGPLPRHPPGWNEWKYTDVNKNKYRNLVLSHYLYPNDWITLNPFEY